MHWSTNSVMDNGVRFQAEGRVDGRSDVVRRIGGRVWIGGNVVSSSDDLTPLHSCSSKQPGEAWAPMISTTLLVDFWGSAKFAQQYHHRISKTTAGLKVVQKSGYCLIKW